MSANAPIDYVAFDDAMNRVSAGSLGTEIDCNGYRELSGAIPSALIELMRESISAQLVANGGEYFGLAGGDWFIDTPLAPLLMGSALIGLLSRLYEYQMHAASTSNRITASLRVVAGVRGLRHANRYHYDSYVVTALLPIIIPDAGDEPPGSLVMFPNLRRVRRSAVVNIIEKLLVENALSRRLWSLRPVQHLAGATPVMLKPGNLYLFWGMRSLHANLACLPSSVRATVIFHFGDPHATSPAKRLSGQLHQLKLRWLDRPRIF